MTTVRRNVLRAVGVACLVTLGGERSFAQSEAKEAPEPNVELRRYPLPHAQEALRRELRESAGRIDDLENEVKALRAEVRALTTALHAQRDLRGPAVAGEEQAREPASPPAGSAPEPSTGRKDAPAVFRLQNPNVAGGGYLVVVSPDGHKVAVSDTKGALSKSVKLGESGGSRHSVRPVSDSSGSLVALAVAGPKITRLAVLSIGQTPGPALPPMSPVELSPVPAGGLPDRTASSTDPYTWYPIDLREPVEEANPAVQDYSSAIYTLGRRVYAFSRPARRWDVLELPKGADPVHGFDADGPTVEHAGHIYTFGLSAGKWSDLDVRSILGKP